MFGSVQRGAGEGRHRRPFLAMRFAGGAGPRRSARQARGLLLVGVAFAAFVAVPGLHFFDHQDDHVHVGGHTVFHTRDLAHSHDSPEPSPDEDSERREGESVCHFNVLAVAAEAPDPVEFPFLLEEARVEPWPPPFVRVLRTAHHARAPPA